MNTSEHQDLIDMIYVSVRTAPEETLKAIGKPDTPEGDDATMQLSRRIAGAVEESTRRLDKIA